MNNAIVIHFLLKHPDNMQIKQRIQNMKKIQKKDSNIWIISKEKMNISQSAYEIERRFIW